MHWITYILGLVFLAAPYVLGFRDHTVAMATSIILGRIIAMLSAFKGFLPDGRYSWDYWIGSLAGIAAVVAPNLLGFSDHTAALWSSVVIGAAVAVLSAYQLVQTSVRPT